MTLKKILFFLIFFLSSLAIPCLAESGILINEFLIDPQPQKVELINAGSESVDISGWIVDDNGGSSGIYTIPSGSVINPNSCLVFSKDFNFNKSTSDSARLFDPSMNLVDSYQYKSSPGSGISYSRIPDKEPVWATTSATIGYYNSGGSSCIFVPTPTAIITEEPSPTPETEPTPTTIQYQSIANVYISEVMVNPETGQNEWVEIYNGNEHQVTLADWFIDDEEDAGATPKKFSMEIGGQSYKALLLSGSTFNNDGDNVRLLDPNKNFIDGFEYGSSIKGVSFGRSSFDNPDFCLQEESYERTNNQCIDEVTITPTDKTTLTTDSTSPTISISKIKPTLNRVTIKAKSRSAPRVVKPSIRPGSYEEILGASDNRAIDYNLLIKHLSVVSFAYSLLTLVSVLFKMTNIYEKGKWILPASIHSPRGQ